MCNKRSFNFNKLLKKLSHEESMQHKILIWLGANQEEIIAQEIIARRLKIKRSTLNYHLVAFKRVGIIDESLQLTKRGKEIFFELWKTLEITELRTHHTQIIFYLSKCPKDYLIKYKNKILKPLTNKKYNGFQFMIGDFNCIFYSEKTILCYVKNIFTDSPELIISQIQNIAEKIKSIIEEEFHGVEINGFEMAKIQFGHVAITNSFLSKKLDSYGYIFKGKGIDVDHSLSLNEMEITNFKINNLSDIEALKKIDRDFQEFMERDRQPVEQEQQDTH